MIALKQQAHIGNVLSCEVISVGELKNGLSFLEDWYDVQLVVKHTGSERQDLHKRFSECQWLKIAIFL